jgi:hypothetical protein
MSWDVLIQDFGDYPDIESIPEHFVPQPLGNRSVLIAAITSRIPQVDFSDQSWGLVDTTDGSIEINIGNDELCNSIMLHVRGAEATFRCVTEIAALTGGRAFDCSAGRLLDPETSQGSLDQWRAYRDQIVAGYVTQVPKTSLLQRLRNFVFKSGN